MHNLPPRNRELGTRQACRSEVSREMSLALRSLTQCYAGPRKTDDPQPGTSTPAEILALAHAVATATS